ncbi:P-type conjugative transfer protein TrbJ [Caulobacter flavus]|uniref:P-type conjugative transfer protein TrbJ n=1 Tax=Caulobacter flavus TaxID=1679497 RepID=A0A2N5CW23_9CAUL|nr:P-type conjugative transfer protein TrbJ [Caulobacter flavus]AYV48256.1 P-type conjugative transfer protein TrbJ [Caulobacter flavus]PLR18009.1 P-type conjugative transfer protein TrbJ [Caulobacter flavus]
MAGPTRRRLLLAVTTLACLPLPPAATAQVTVFDPSNYAQNVLTAARTLQSINNQIQALQNQAQGLINDARNLTGLPFSSLSALQGQLQRTRALIGQAQRLAYDVSAIEAAFKDQFGAAALTATDRDLVGLAQSRWSTSVAAFQDALKVQAGVVGNLDGARDQMTQLVQASQSADGALQAAQAGNQLMALQSQQLADLLALMAAQGRAQNLDAAARAAAQDQAREQMRRFLTPGTGYQAPPVTLFSK